MKPTKRELVAGLLMLVLCLALSFAFVSCSGVDKTSCKYKVAQQKKAIKAKQAVKVVPYYARVHRRK